MRWRAAIDAAPGFWLPRQSATTAPPVDGLFYSVTGIAVFFFLLITVGLLWFVWKYRARPGHDVAPSPTHHTPLEVTWTVVPLFIVVWIFWKGFTVFVDLSTAPANAYEVQVTAQKWNWLFTYATGYTDTDLHVPPGEPIRVVGTAVDVIHSFFVPEFRVKKDIVPGRYDDVWFRTDVPGRYQIYCAEYCGKDHSAMTAQVIVHASREEFDRWLAEASDFIAKLPPERLAEGGEKLYNQRGCKQCHSIDGRPGTGPSFKGIWGHDQPLREGGVARVDENYVRQSIVDPHSQIVAGYEAVMPSFQGRLNDKEITALIEYIKTLK